jgi:hypothetical protein
MPKTRLSTEEIKESKRKKQRERYQQNKMEMKIQRLKRELSKAKVNQGV